MHNLFDALDESQKQAVFHSHGPALVVAGPGSGKTTVILSRVWYLISRCQIPPEQILVLTFTKAAARTLQSRLLTFNNGQYVPVSFGTFHSFFYQILKQYGSYKDSNIITTKEKQNILEEIGIKDKSLYKDILYAISFKLNNPNADESHILPKEFTLEDFNKVLGAYLEVIQRDNLLDFDYMAELTWQLLAGRQNVLCQLQRQYKYILVDEFQDTNPHQYAVLKMLSNKSKELFAVGDDDQAIYSFRGSFPGIMQQFVEDYNPCINYYLSTNYRSAQMIVKDAGRLISNNKDRLDKEIKPYSKEIGKVQYLSFEENREEYEFIKRRVLRLKEDMPWDDMAVIARTNKQLEQLIPYFQRGNIPYVNSEKTRISSNGVINDLIMLIGYILGDATKVRLWRKIVKNGSKEAGFWADKPPSLFMNYLIHGTDYLEYIKKNQDYEENRMELYKLVEESKNYKDMHIFAAEIKQKRVQKTEHDSGVHLLTMHGAKGLEFAYVALIDINEGIIPGKGNISMSQIEEERRMLYVGMTRAKKILDVCYLKGTKEHPRFVSRFLNPLLMKENRD